MTDFFITFGLVAMFAGIMFQFGYAFAKEREYWNAKDY